MSSQPITRNIRHSATALPAKKSSFKAAFLSFARDMWHSYQRHSQYQVMLSAGRHYATPEQIVHNRSKQRQG